MSKFLSFLFAFIYASASYSGVGDTYTCLMDNFIKLKGDELTNIAPQEFKFKWHQNQVEFKGQGYFEIALPMELTVNLGDVEVWKATGQKSEDLLIQSEAIFRQGSFSYSYLSYNDSAVYAITATCEKL